MRLIVEILHVKTDLTEIHRLNGQLDVQIDIALLGPSGYHQHPRRLARFLVQEIQTRRETPPPPHRHRPANVHPRDPMRPRKPLRRMPHKHASLVCRVRTRPHTGRARTRVLERDGIDREAFAGSEDAGDGVHEGAADVGRDGPLVGEGETVVVCDDGVWGGRVGGCEEEAEAELGERRDASEGERDGGENGFGGVCQGFSAQGI